MTSAAGTDAPVYFPHPRVLERHDDGVATVTILAPRNPLLMGQLTPLLFAPVATAVGAILAGVILGSRWVGSVLLALFACGLAWLVAELPAMLRGLHTRVEFVVAPDELRATIRHLWMERTSVFRRDQVLGVRVVSLDWRTRALHVRFTDAEPLELMSGFPDEHIAAAAGALRQALAEVAPATPVLRVDDVATLPYAGAGRSYEVEILRLADGVSVTVPPPLRNATRALGGVVFALMWLVMFAFLFRATMPAMWWCPIVPMFLVGGTWALAVAVRDYARRNEPLRIVLTPRELVIENGPWFRPTRRIPRERVDTIEYSPSGKERRFVLAIKGKGKIHALELMTDREPDEIQRVVKALNELL